jgi:hypothetical protein
MGVMDDWLPDSVFKTIDIIFKPYPVIAMHCMLGNVALP